MPIDMRRPMIAAIQAALDEVKAEPPKKKRHGVGAGGALLVGAGLYTAGRVVTRGRGRGLIDALEQRLPHQRDGSDDEEQYDDEPEDDDADEEFDDGEPEADADEEPEGDVDEEPEAEADADEPEPEAEDEEPPAEGEGDEPEPEAEADDEPEDADEEPEEEAPKPRRGSRGRATRTRK
jgi:hypothetical protein